MENAERTLAAPQDWPGLKLGREAREALAEAAPLVRFGDAGGSATSPIKPEQLLAPRRIEDRAEDLWTVWHVVQENSIKGGLRGVRRDEFGRARRSTSRPINGIDQDIKLNKALWLFGSLALWLFGSLALWLFGERMATLLHR